MKGLRKRRRRSRPRPRQRAWVYSAAGRAAARAATQASRVALRRKPRCGAKRKTDGQPCRALALANGRCRFTAG